jgi:alanine racemase
MTPPRRTWAEIDLRALRHNFETARSLLPAGTGLMAVVKANAYGHGAILATQALAGEAALLGVANLNEALEIQPHAGRTPIFLLGPALPDERPLIAAHGFIPSLSSLAEARDFSALGEAQGRPVSAHLIFDTGMGRIGIWEEEAPEVARQIAALPGLRIIGLGSHFPVADEDLEFTRAQLSRFHELAARLRREHFPEALLHIENSAGIIEFPDHPGNLVRPGLMLYGNSPLPEFQARLQPVMTWKTRITLVREVGPGRGVSYGRTYITERPMRLATLAVGYADGLRRHLSNRGADVLIGGRRCVIVGRVTMDQIVVDITGLPEAREGDEVVLLGRQGEEQILATEVAERAGTIAWDIFTGIGRRVERFAVE